MLTVTVVLVSLVLGPGARAAAGPQVPRPRRRPHAADRAVPGGAGRGGPAVEARASTTRSTACSTACSPGSGTLRRDARSRTGSPSYPMRAVEAALVWQWTPFMMLILLAGLQSRPATCSRRPRVDGAERLADLPPHDPAAPAPVPGTGRPARLDLRGAELRRGLHHHLGRPGHRQPAVHHLPDASPPTTTAWPRPPAWSWSSASIIIATFALRVSRRLFREEAK